MKIEFVRGDTTKLTFTRKNKDGEAILSQPQEIYFTVKKNAFTNDILLQKKLEDMSFNQTTGEYTFYILPDDFDADIYYGTYKFDLEVKDTLNNIDYVQTIAFGDLVIKEEITFKSNEV